MQKPEYKKIPDSHADFKEVAKQMRINVDILKEEITKHIDDELKRFKMGKENVDS